LRKMKSLFGIHLTYDRVFSWVAIIAACVIVINVRCTISMRVGLTMMTSIKVQKTFIVIMISSWHQVWQGRRWETSFLTMCSIFQSNSCDNISKCIMDYCMLTLARALKQMNT
jgi:hypothetical protein